MRGEDIIISEENYRNQVRGLMLILWNTYNFFVTYAQADEWKPSNKELKPTNVLDKWILSRFNGNIKNITERGYEKFDTPEIVGQANIFISDLSAWYVRRIRDRVGPTAPNGQDKEEAYQTLWFVLKEYCKVLAPLIPFISEEIYRNLTGEDSVHLAKWPTWDEKLLNNKLEIQMNDDMVNARKIVEKAHALRKQAEIKVRIPIREMTYDGPSELSEEVLDIVKSEINVYNLKFGKKIDNYMVITKTSDDNLDLQFGLARDIVRKIQEERKKLAAKPNDKVTITIPFWPKEHEGYIKRKALVSKISEGKSFSVSKDD
jgi:isoleucyl-tRNA synthetase